MKKRRFLLLLMVLTALLATSCGKKKDDATEAAEEKSSAVKEECIDFVGTKLPAIAQERNEAIALYNKDFAGGSVDTDQLLTDLKNTAIPKMESYINKLSAIETTSKEVTDLKVCYMQSAQKQYDAMKMVVSAVEGENPDYLMQADNLINEADTLLAQFDQMLSETASANGFTVKKASATDAN